MALGLLDRLGLMDSGVYVPALMFAAVYLRQQANFRWSSPSPPS